jgi:hypothetical protein
MLLRREAFGGEHPSGSLKPGPARKTEHEVLGPRGLKAFLFGTCAGGTVRGAFGGVRSGPGSMSPREGKVTQQSVRIVAEEGCGTEPARPGGALDSFDGTTGRGPSMSPRQEDSGLQSVRMGRGRRLPGRGLGSFGGKTVRGAFVVPKGYEARGGGGQRCCGEGSGACGRPRAGPSAGGSSICGPSSSGSTHLHGRRGSRGRHDALGLVDRRVSDGPHAGVRPGTVSRDGLGRWGSVGRVVRMSERRDSDIRTGPVLVSRAWVPVGMSRGSSCLCGATGHNHLCSGVVPAGAETARSFRQREP